MGKASVNYANSAGSVAWNNVSGKPSTFVPAGHTHPASQITDIGSASVNYANSAGSVAWGNVSGKPGSFTPSGHTHDDRYYTESEMNTKLSAKFDTGRVKTKSWVATVSGNYLDVSFSSVGLTNGANYAIIINNANRAANTLTVTGVSLLQQPASAFRIYWDDIMSNASVQFNMVAIQF